MMTDASKPSGSSELDLAFIIDATGSMGTYIESAKQVHYFTYEPIEKQHQRFFSRICWPLLVISSEAKNAY